MLCVFPRVSLHSTKLESYQLPFLARALDKGCHKLTSLSIIHCAIRDTGIKEFVSVCNKESFNTLEVLDLTDNRISGCLHKFKSNFLLF